jgi:hypothetical protein
MEWVFVEALLTDPEGDTFTLRVGDKQGNYRFWLEIIVSKRKAAEPIVQPGWIAPNGYLLRMGQQGRNMRVY